MANTSGPQASIGNGQTMNENAAIYYNALTLNIKREDSIDIVPTEGTRTYARQKYLYEGYLAGRIDPSTGQRFNPAYSPDSPYAYHLSGRAVDVGSSVGYTNTPASKAFYGKAGKFGFRPTVQGEPWHFEWRLEWVSPDLDLATVNADPEIPTVDPEEDIMHIISSSTRGQMLIDNGQPIALGTAEEVQALMRANVRVVEVPASLFDRYAARAWR